MSRLIVWCVISCITAMAKFSFSYQLYHMDSHPDSEHSVISVLNDKDTAIILRGFRNLAYLSRSESNYSLSIPFGDYRGLSVSFRALNVLSNCASTEDNFNSSKIQYNSATVKYNSNGTQSYPSEYIEFASENYSSIYCEQHYYPKTDKRIPIHLGKVLNVSYVTSGNITAKFDVTITPISYTCDLHDDFKCTNGICISTRFVCDGRNNCGDNSDEIIKCKEMIWSFYGYFAIFLIGLALVMAVPFTLLCYLFRKRSARYRVVDIVNLYSAQSRTVLQPVSIGQTVPVSPAQNVGRADNTDVGVQVSMEQEERVSSDTNSKVPAAPEKSNSNSTEISSQIRRNETSPNRDGPSNVSLAQYLDKKTQSQTTKQETNPKTGKDDQESTNRET